MAARHLDDHDLAGWLDQTLDPAGRDRIAAHLADCPACRAAVADVVRASDEARGEVPPALAARARGLELRPHRAAWTPTRVAGLAAAAALVAAATWSLAPRRDGAGEAPREPAALEESIATTRSGAAATPLEMVMPREGTTVAASGLVLRWVPVPGVDHYRVRLTTDDGALVWETHAVEAQVAVPPEAGLERGRTYFVLLSAALPGQKAMAPSATKFTVDAAGREPPARPSAPR